MTTQSNALLAFGRFAQSEQEELQSIASEASLDFRLTESVQDAVTWLNHTRPRALLIDNSDEQASDVCLEARAHADQALTPIISISRQLDDLSFADVFSWGGDDAVDLRDSRPLLSRVRALPRDAAHAPPSRGTVVIADPDRSRRVILARVLRNAGYDVQFELSAAQLGPALGAGTDIRLVIVDHELAGGLESLLACAKAHPKVQHILLCAPRHFPENNSLLVGLRNAALADSFAPPENLVFMANELERGGVNEQRASRRVLYGTTVCFRGSGREVDDYGFSYNISAGGLYVRTLAPPKEDLVWLELRPPRVDRRVRLEGEVVWRRGFGPSTHATVPPGFGVKIIDATASNRETWSVGYNEFLVALGHDTHAPSV